MRLTSRAFLDTPSGEPPHVKLAMLGGRARVDRADRRAGRSARSRARGRADRSCGGALRAACRAVRRPALCRAAAPRPAGRESRSSRRCSISPMPTDLPLVATNEPFYARREDFEAHDALICIAEGRHRRRDRAAPALHRALLQVARRDDGAVRRSARGARLDGRDRAALRVPSEDAQADPAALHR